MSPKAPRRASRRLTALLKEVRAGKGTVGKLFTDEQLYRDLNTLLTSAEGVVAGINKGKGTLGQLMNDPAAYRSLQASLEEPAEDHEAPSMRARAASADC